MTMNYKAEIIKHFQKIMVLFLFMFMGIMIIVTTQPVSWNSEIAIFINYLLVFFYISNLVLFGIIYIKGCVWRTFSWWKKFFIFDSLFLLILFQILVFILDAHEFKQLSKSMSHFISVFGVCIPSLFLYFGFISLISLKSNAKS